MDALSNIVESVINNESIDDFLSDYLKSIKNKLNIDSLVYYNLEDQTFIKKRFFGMDHHHIDLIKKEEIFTLFNESNIVKLDETSQINELYKQHIAYAILINLKDDAYRLVLIENDTTNSQYSSFFREITNYFQPITNITLDYNDYRQSIIDTCVKITSPILRSISHDVRNPIQMISILIEMLKAKDLTLEKRLGLHTKISNGISQIDKIITDISELFKKNYDINISKVSCSSFFEDIKTEMASLLKKSKITFELNLEYESTIETDIEKAKDIIMKMLKYSTELIQGSGLIVLSVEEIGDNIKISIVDTSNGIGTKILNNQRNPFFALDGRLGTGLNFSIMHGIIETLSGKLTIYNQKEGGAVFEIIIPKKAT